MLFFSYSRGNLLLVRSVASELRRLGYRTWLDVECLRPGERWREAIQRALAASDAMVYCISHLSLESAWTSVELQAAHDRGLPVVPLLIDEVPIEKLPPTLRELQIISSVAWTERDAASHAARAIARSIGGPAPPPSRCADGAPATLRVEVRADAAGAVALAWASVAWRSPPAPLSAESLAELARVADDARAAELCVGERVEPVVAALVLGTLASRLGPARVRVDADAALMSALTEACRSVQASR
jgi:hypothetical protein